MCRSVIIKGLESLLTESMISARHYGVEKEVLASLSDMLPVPDWPKLARYMISRSLEHGVRRAEEMREVAKTVQEAGLEPLMSAACAERQDWAALHKGALGEAELGAMLDHLLKDIEAEHKRGAA
jgi:3-hydroxyisobutyrate dehydrogenase-like beta-hydroxyacid dehydrogenase